MLEGYLHSEPHLSVVSCSKLIECKKRKKKKKPQTPTTRKVTALPVVGEEKGKGKGMPAASLWLGVQQLSKQCPAMLCNYLGKEVKIYHYSAVSRAILNEQFAVQPCT